MNPSYEVQLVIDEISRSKSMRTGMRTVMERKNEFPSMMAAQLTGIALDPNSRNMADELLDDYWTRNRTLSTVRKYPEIIIGSGYHAAVYCANRVLAGFPKPTVIERDKRAGGVFAIPGDVFYLNSRTRAGGAGLSGDLGANLNYLPGAPIQASNISNRDYQTNREMAWIIRMTLAQYAHVVTDTKLTSVANSRFDGTIELNLDDRLLVSTKRLIDSRGLGDAKDQNLSNGTTIITFPEFMTRMATKWPLRGIKRAAVIGGGDAARCAIESLLGLGPQPMMTASVLDTVERIDAYGQFPSTKDSWCARERGRYQAIGRYLKPDLFGVRRLNIFNQSGLVTPVNIPGQPTIDGRSYDLIVIATGNVVKKISGLTDFFNGDLIYQSAGNRRVARKARYSEIYQIGPLANLPFSSEEISAEIDRIDNNRVAMFRLGSKTAALAATLPQL